MSYTTRRARLGALSIACAALTLAFGPPAGNALAADRTERTTLTWFDEMEAYFDAHPELKGKSGTGYNPYMRSRWFLEQRMYKGKLPDPTLRWKVWEKKQAMVAEMPGLRANTWFSLGPTNYGGRMLSMDFDPNNNNIVYAGGADGGVWKTTDQGTTWTPIADELPNLAIGGLAVNKTDPLNIVVGTGETGGTLGVGYRGGIGILRTTDGGATWLTTDYSLSPGGNEGVHFVLSTATGAFVAGTSDGIYRSSDNGATWVQRRGGGHWYDGQISPVDPATIWTVRGDATPGASVKVSTDDGVSWTKPGSGQPPSLNFGKSKLGVSGSTVYCAIGVPGSSGGFYGVIKSTDNGATWTDLSATSTGLPGSSSSAQAWYNVACAADPNNADRVLVGLVQAYRSNDGGLSFSTVTGGIHADQHVFMYEPGSNVSVWAGNDGGMWRNNTDGGPLAWTDKNNGLVTYQFYDICTSHDTGTDFVLGGTQDNGTDRWSGTTTWTSELGGDGFVCNIGGTNSAYAYGELYFGNHYKSVNRGLSWTSFNSGIASGPDNQWVVPVALDYNDEQHLLTVNGTGSGIYRSTNGSSWTQVANHGAVWIDISRVNGQVAYSIVGSTVYTTTDNGNSWTSHNLPFLTGGGTKVLADPVDVNTVWATFSSYQSGVSHVAKSTDQGTTWTDISGDLPAVPVNAIAVDPSAPGDIYIGTDVGVWLSRNNGTNWYPVGGSTLPNSIVTDLEIRDNDRKMVAGTFGRGAWEITIPAELESGVVGVDVAVNPELRNLMLERPFPNPVSDRTLLRYAVHSDAPVSLRIYDVNGRVVSDLEDFSRGDGIVRTTPWFTENVSSGVYFAVLQAGDLRKSEKITVIK